MIKMEYTGNLSKMITESGNPIRYFLKLGENKIFVNDLIGKIIDLKFEGIIHCVACGREIKKAFGQGFCYPCFLNSPLNSECILKPELCLAHEGKGRDPQWEEENHNQPHYVYLAQTSGIKVGVTRINQVPTRWIDQGAWKAIKIALTPYRFLAGRIEVHLKKDIADRTPWQKMLKNETDKNLNLLDEKERIIYRIDPEFHPYLLKDENEIDIFEYPVIKYPEMVKSINLDKSPSIHSKLIGIRGQYLIFEDDRVINLRNHSGYKILLSV